MNAIKMANQMDLYLDVSRNGRFERFEYDHAVNNAIRQFTERIIDQKGVQSNQSTSDDLYTLLKTQTAAPTADIALLPADYLYLNSLYATIGGTEYYCRPTTHGQLGALKQDTFRRPSDTKPYYTQELTGFLVHHGVGSITSCRMQYYKVPATFTIGKDSQLINAGTSISNATSYTATLPDTIHNGVTYNAGDVFTSASTTLTAGQVILTSGYTSVDLPDKVHEAIIQLACKILKGVISDYNSSAFAEKQAQQSEGEGK